MKFLVVGAGGREHALCWSLAASPLVSELFCAPGSDAIAREASCVPLAVDDLDGITAFCRHEQVDLVVPGPELPLVLGLADRLAGAGIKVAGPNSAAAQLEGSKAFTKAFCARHRIPTANSRTFSWKEKGSAEAYLREQGAPIVIKADGLAAGKGVTIAATIEQALDALEQAFGGAFGNAGRLVVIEEFLQGQEASLFALVDGHNVLEFGTAQDHKAVGDGDAGPNTGGMGAYAPAPCMTPALTERAMATIIRPTVTGMAAENMAYRGVLYAGLMLTEHGPRLLEYNVRFGDPEAQVQLVRLKSDLAQLLLGISDGVLDHMDLRWHDNAALSVVMATRGYPGAYHNGSKIRGIERAEALEGVTTFHAATRIEQDSLIANGGRVLNITAQAPTLRQARDRAYEAVDQITWPEGFCRRDIGWRALAEATS